MTDVTYWGPFEDVRKLPGLSLTESDPYEGVSAELMTLLLGSQPDVDDYLRLAVSCGTPVLELGCGDGRVLTQLARHGISVIGVDLSAEMLRKLSLRTAELSPEDRAQINVIQA